MNTVIKNSAGRFLSQLRTELYDTKIELNIVGRNFARKFLLEQEVNRLRAAIRARTRPDGRER